MQLTLACLTKNYEQCSVSLALEPVVRAVVIIKFDDREYLITCYSCLTVKRISNEKTNTNNGSLVLLLVTFIVQSTQIVNVQYNKSYCSGKKTELMSRAEDW